MKDRESGFSLVELAVALVVVAVLIGVAIPLYLGMRRESVETAAQAELREALVPLRAHLLDGDESLSLPQGVRSFNGTVRFDDSAVAGIKLEAASDGSTCLWRIADTGTVYGVWAAPDGGTALFTEAGSLPGSCPDEADAAAQGFVASW